MIDPSEIVDNLVELLRDIPDLVQLMAGDADRIYAYHDRYPDKMSLQREIDQVPAPGIMAAYVGTEPGDRGGFMAWLHRITLYVRPQPENADEARAGHYAIFRQIVKGVPSSRDNALLYETVHDSCEPMNLPTFSRQSDVESVDFFEVSLSFTEIGDD